MYFLYPMLELLKSCWAIYIKHNQNDSSIFIVNFGDGPVSFLAGGVPDIQGYLLAIFEEMLFLVKQEPEGRLCVFEEEVLQRVTIDYARFAHP